MCNRLFFMLDRYQIYLQSFIPLGNHEEERILPCDLVRLEPTNFATNCLALQSLKSKNDYLKRLFAGPNWSSMRKERESDVGTQIEELVHKKKF